MSANYFNIERAGWLDDGRGLIATMPAGATNAMSMSDRPVVQDLQYKKILVTGGGGFIGSHLVEHILAEHSPCDLTVADIFTYAGDRENLRDVLPYIKLVEMDVTDPAFGFEIGPQDVIFHLAAETHVDRSITNSIPFVQTDMLGTAVVLEWARVWGSERFVFVSTDEVYGDANDFGTPSRELHLLNPSNPYSAAKAGADMLVRAFHRTHDLDVVVVRPSNHYGPRQYPEKVLPRFILQALKQDKLPVFGSGKQVREWTYVEDGARGIAEIARYGRTGQAYNLSSQYQMSVLELAEIVCRKFDLDPQYAILHGTERPGEDMAYSLDMNKTEAEIPWHPKVSSNEGIRRTIQWYKANQDRLLEKAV